jgi:hypothetical protein
MAARISQFATVTVIALIVWLYAEGATRQVREISVKVQFVALDGQVIVGETTRTVEAVVRCATSQLAALNRLAADPIRITVAAVEGQTDVEVNLLEKLRSSERISRIGVTIDRLDQEFAKVNVDSLVTIEMKIELATPKDLELTGPAVFAVEQAKVTLPAAQAKEAPKLKLQAVLSHNNLEGVVPGVQEQREVDIDLPASLANIANVTVGLAKVKVTFTIKKKEDEHTVGIVQVFLHIRPKDNEQYTIHVDAEDLVLRDVKITGPSDVIKRLKEQTGQPIEAVLRLEPEDLENARDAKLPELRLPPGVTVQSPLPLIKMKIKRREAASAS